MVKNIHQTCFYTASLGCASTLSVSGLKVHSFEIRAQRSRIFYLFDDCDAAKRLADSYWLNQLSLNPKALFEEARDIKFRLNLENQR